MSAGLYYAFVDVPDHIGPVYVGWLNKISGKFHLVSDVSEIDSRHGFFTRNQQPTVRKYFQQYDVTFVPVRPDLNDCPHERS